jgi:hypothetical protein
LENNTKPNQVTPDKSSDVAFHIPVKTLNVKAAFGNPRLNMATVANRDSSELDIERNVLEEVREADNSRHEFSRMDGRVDSAKEPA